MKTDWKNFKKEELVCKCCGTFNPNPEFQILMDDVQKLRDICGFPFHISSGYRCSKNPEEAKKAKPGQHNKAAVDIQVATPQQYFDLMEQAVLTDDFTGLGFSMKGDMSGRFIHLDQRPLENRSIWSY